MKGYIKRTFQKRVIGLPYKKTGIDVEKRKEHIMTTQFLDTVIYNDETYHTEWFRYGDLFAPYL